MKVDHQTTVQISKEQRENWEGYISESREFSSKADLIRRSVSKEIHGDFQQDNTAVDTEAVAEVRREVRELRSLIEDLRGSIDTIEARTREPSEHIRDLTNDVFRVLPAGADHIWQWERKEVPPNTGKESDPVAHSGSLTAIANTLDEDEFDVKQALTQLQEDSHRVQTVEINGERRWFKEV